MKKKISAFILIGIISLFSTSAIALPGCGTILNALNVTNRLGVSPPANFGTVHTALKAAADAAIIIVQSVGIGLGNDMWATITDRDGVICAVAFTGADRGSQWPGSRIISAEKAYTANAYSLDGFAVSTANLYAPNLDGQGFYGLQFSNLMNASVAYGKNLSEISKYGLIDDPLTENILGGHIIFGGGFGLYANKTTIMGGVGASGDTACYDHAFAWIVRDILGLDRVPAGVAPGTPSGTDNMIYNNGVDPFGGFEHVDCGFGEMNFVEALPSNYPTGP